MYNDFFSFTRDPFSISPDPSFLFLSDRHKEALAHLQHGLKEKGGFLLLTGEVGTGKTLIARCLLNDPKDKNAVASILNPTLSDVELLQSLCEQFQILTSSRDLDALFSKLTDWLTENTKKGCDAVVLIDEAQHLSLPALEQLLLLTQLNSNNKKLLQVLLIGQTELQEKLKEDAFRALAQNITSRYHLLPLTLTETAYYIQHRLSHVGGVNEIFIEKSLPLIYKITKGTPRLINILCDRCLLSAFSQNSYLVNSKIVKEAAKELNLLNSNKKTIKSISNVHLLLTVLVFALSLFQLNNYLKDDVPLSVVSTEQQKIPLKEIQKEKSHNKFNWFDDYDHIELSSQTFNQSLKTLYQVWGYQVDFKEDGCNKGKAVHLSCETDFYTFDDLIRLNYPSIVTLKNDKDEDIYVVFYKFKDKNVQLLLNEQLVAVSIDWFIHYWDGEATMLWQAPFKLKGNLKFGQKSKQVAWLAKSLSNNSKTKKVVSEYFNLTLQSKVRDFQRKNGLSEDGIVGKETLMMLVPLQNKNSPRLLNKENN